MFDCGSGTPLMVNIELFVRVLWRLENHWKTRFWVKVVLFRPALKYKCTRFISYSTVASPPFKPSASTTLQIAKTTGSMIGAKATCATVPSPTSYCLTLNETFRKIAAPFVFAYSIKWQTPPAAQEGSLSGSTLKTPTRATPFLSRKAPRWCPSLPRTHLPTKSKFWKMIIFDEKMKFK